MEWEDIETQEPETQQAAMSGWSIKNLLEDKELLQAAKDEWNMTSKGQAHLRLSYTKEDLDREVEWFESRLTELLNSHAKITQITAHSKRWWNEEVAEARKTWAKDKKRLGKCKRVPRVVLINYHYYLEVQWNAQREWMKLRVQGELGGRKGRSQVGQRWIAGWLRADLAMRIDQGGFAKRSRCDHAKRELPAADRVKAIDQGEMAE